MKIKKGKTFFKLDKPIGQLTNVVCVNQDIGYFPLVYMKELELDQIISELKERKTYWATPRYIAFNPNEQYIKIWPAPNKDMELEIMFFPPLDKQ